MGYIKYTESFKREAVKKCKVQGSIYWVADLLGVQPNTLRRWVREYDEESQVLLTDKNC